MKVAVPVTKLEGPQSQVSSHLGRAAGFILFEPEEEEVEVIENTSEHMGGKGKPPGLLAEAGVDVLLCFNLGVRAIKRFEEYDVEVYVNCQGTAEDALIAWQQGELEEASAVNACRRHGRFE